MFDKCRLCLQPTDNEGINIFNKTTNKVSFHDKVMLCVPITITEDDDLPKEICVKCTEMITLFCKFRENCMEADRELKVLFQDPQNTNSNVDLLAEEHKYANCIDLQFYEQDNSNQSEGDHIIYTQEMEGVEIKEEILNFQDISFTSDLILENVNLISQENGINDVFLMSTESENQIEEVISQRSKSDQTTCLDCGKSFASSTGLKYHLLVHSDKKPYLCVYCGRTFRVFGQLNFHLKVHNGKSPHICETCDKTFLRPSDLEKHERKHTGEKPYKCDYCDRSFSQISGLTTHTQLHTGNRPYNCSYCSKTFIQLANKIKHERIHDNGKKLYACNVPHCGKSFIDQLGLELHRAGHDGGKRRCEECDRSFKTASQLYTHLKKFHTKSFLCLVCRKKFPTSSSLHSNLKLPLKCSTCTTICEESSTKSN